MRGTPYGIKRFPPFSIFGAPCNAPPWASAFRAFDVDTGEEIYATRTRINGNAAPMSSPRRQRRVDRYRPFRSKPHAAAA
jgi:glucose dehydrogenase